MIYAFENCELDTRSYELRRDGELQSIEPQVFDVLVHLVKNRDRVVTKKELLDEVWGHRFVEESTLSTRVMAARRAVGDDGTAQRIIRTIHGRGFRFVAEVEERELDVPRSDVAAPADIAPARAEVPRPIGRDAEMEALGAALDDALAGRRRVVFVTGEAGLGKTTLVDAFLAAAREREPALGIARGQCLEHVGPGEPYGPVLEAIGRLGRGPKGEDVVALLDRRAPTWLVQIPSLVEAERLEELQRRLIGVRPTPRALTEALEEWTAVRPLVLVLEDLHWSDPSTVDLLGWLARRGEAARLLVVGTFRPADARAAEHPVESLRRDLAVRSLAEEVALEPLDADAVAAVLAERVPGAEADEEIVELLLDRSGGNPLFLKALLDAWTSAGAITRAGDEWGVAASVEDLRVEIPETLQLLIEGLLARLEPEDREILSTAAVAGFQFSSAAVAAGLGLEVEPVEARLDRLARHERFIDEVDPRQWPDGTHTSRYRFTHHLYLDVLYDRIPSGRRARFHQRIGARLEAAFGHRAGELTPELVLHFVRGGDPVRAVRYLRMAAERSMRRGAPREAIGHLTAGLDLIRSRDDLPGRERLEHAFEASLGKALLLTRGWGADEAERSFRRACEIGERLGETDLLIPALYGLAVLLEYRAEYDRSREIMEEVLELGPEHEELRLQVHELLACSMFHQGAFSEAIEIARRGLEGFDPERRSAANADFGDDSVMSCHAWAGLAAWFLGRPDEALERAETAVRMARDPEREYCLANALGQAARIHHLRRDVARTKEAAAEAIELADRQGFAYFGAVARVLHGWARVMEGDDGGVEEIERGIETHAATGARMDRPYFLGVLAEAFAAVGRTDDALEAVRRGLADLEDGRPFFDEPELVRLEGELILRIDPERAAEDAEDRFLRALERARELGAPSSELRAATRLARLWGDERADEARTLLEPLLAKLKTSRDTPDYAEAHELLGTGPKRDP